MTRNAVRGFGLLASFALVMSITGTAQAKPKKHKGGGASMTFSPEEVHQDEPSSGGKKKPMSFTPEAVKPTGPAGPPSKVLERALKLSDAEDYTNASIELK